MKITCMLRDSKNNIEELVTVEGWVRGHDLYLMLVPNRADSVYLEVVDGNLTLRCKDHAGGNHSHILRKFK